jgi:hypothetical protein
MIPHESANQDGKVVQKKEKVRERERDREREREREKLREEIQKRTIKKDIEKFGCTRKIYACKKFTKLNYTPS